MSDVVSMLWFKMGENVTHLCGGHTEKEKMNKPKGTQTQTTDWFNPAKLEEDVYTCMACGKSAKTNDGAIFTTIGEENGEVDND